MAVFAILTLYFHAISVSVLVMVIFLVSHTLYLLILPVFTFSTIISHESFLNDTSYLAPKSITYGSSIVPVPSYIPTLAFRYKTGLT